MDLEEQIANLEVEILELKEQIKEKRKQLELLTQQYNAQICRKEKGNGGLSMICNLTGKECPYDKCYDWCPEAKNATIRYQFELEKDLYREVEA